MRRFFTLALATGILFCAVLILLSTRPLAAADDAPTFRQANHSLGEALASGDKKAAAILLDERFQGGVDVFRDGTRFVANQPLGVDEVVGGRASAPVCTQSASWSIAEWLS